jgi:serine/threonine protein kinase
MRRLFAKAAWQRRTDFPRPGELVAGKYRIHRVLGRGGMGVVLAAHHELLNQRVAVKVLTVRDKTGVSRFLREARSTACLGGLHVAHVMDAGILPGGAPFIVMEHLEGSDLKHLLEIRGSLPVEEAVGYVLEACEGLAQAHARRIVHRDLKPANLFLTVQPNGSPIVKILDFGISKPLANSSEKTGTLTEEHTTLGSPAYMAPEQIRAAKGADTRSDIWSIGVVLFELLVGAPPFARNSLGELFAAILETEAPKLGDRLHGAPPELGEALAKCLQRDPALRFHDVLELARAIAPFGPSDSPARVASVEQLLRNVRAPAPLSSPPASAEAERSAVPVSPEAETRAASQVTAHAFTSETPDARRARGSATGPSAVRLRRRLVIRAAGAASILAVVAMTALVRTTWTSRPEASAASAGGALVAAFDAVPAVSSEPRAAAEAADPEPVAPAPNTGIAPQSVVPPPARSAVPHPAPSAPSAPATTRRPAGTAKRHLSVLDSPD